MATKKKTAAKRAAPAAKKKAPTASGPLTVAQARAMVQTAPEPAAKRHALPKADMQRHRAAAASQTSPPTRHRPRWLSSGAS